MRINYKSLLNILGLALMCICLWFISQKVGEYQQALYSALKTNPMVWLWLLGFSVLHCAILNALGIGWHAHLLHLKQAISRIQALIIYGKSQIGKYLPGNVMHFVGRQLLTTQSNLQQKKVLQATLNEIVGHLLGVAICIAVFTCLNTTRAATLLLGVPRVPLNVLLGGLLLLVIALLFKPFRQKVKLLLSQLINGFNPHTLTYYLIFHIASGFMFAGLVMILSNQAVPVTWLMLNYSFAWLIGYLVPGAPGGFGVREAVLVSTLSGLPLTESVILLSAIANRLITTVGDCWFFLEALGLQCLKSGQSSNL